MNDNIRHDWKVSEVEALLTQPFADLMFHAQQVHRENFDHNAVQISTLLSIKTGACPEDCKYCSQSVHNNANIEREPLMDVEAVVEAAKKAKAAGASRFCTAAGWRGPKEKDFVKTLEMIRRVKALGLETCSSLGMVTNEQVKRLEEAGLDYYNHNLDTSPEHYKKIISTRTYQDRLDTLQRVRESSINVCCGGIVGLGETQEDRVGFLCQLANLPEHPQSVPINMLVKIKGTPLGAGDDIDPLDFVRTIAVARIMLPKTFVRLSAGRCEMSDETQAMCFLAGANSIHYGEKLLTTPLPDTSADQALFERLGLHPYEVKASCDTQEEAHA